MERLCFSKSATITANTTWDLDAIDLSNADLIRVVVKLTSGAGASASDLLNIYLQSRDNSGVWEDRVASHQLLGNMASGETREYILQKFGTLADAEEAFEPSGSTGASRLTTATVQNGGFPGPYRSAAGMNGMQPATNFQSNAWRFDFVCTIVGALSFPTQIWVYSDSAI